MPLGNLWLAVVALVMIFANRRCYPWRDVMVVLAPGLVNFIFVSNQTGFSVHSRYAIPALPYFFIWVSKTARECEMRPLTRTRIAVAATVVAALTWSMCSSLWIYPHSLSYFNELVGGPRAGGEHLLNSNIDYGQDLLYLKSWLEQHPNVKLDGLAYWGSYPAKLAGVPDAPYPVVGQDTEDGRQRWFADKRADTLGPKPGYYAVSVNCLYDRDKRYRYFLHFKPAALAGYTIYIYHLMPEDTNRARRELGLPELPEGDDGDRRSIRDAPRTRRDAPTTSDDI